MPVRIGVVTPMDNAMDAVAEAFADVWPEAQAITLLDESLYADYGGGKGVTDETYERMAVLLQYSQDTGADGIVFCGSVFGRVVEAVRENLSVPVLSAQESMIEEAFAAGSRFGILTTVSGSLQCLLDDIDRYSKEHGKPYTLVQHVEDAARPIILAGDVETHDQMVAAAADKMTDCDCLMLGQFSMTSAVKQFTDMPGRPVLTAPHTSVRKLKRLLWN